jgi:hypothetical protein
LAQSTDPVISAKYKEFMKKGLETLQKRAGEYDDPFLNGIPFIWCSNNLVTAALTQAMLYFDVSGDDTFLEMEAALRDWLLGCNPWGTSMICGYPAHGDFPSRPHSYFAEILHEVPDGGLVDGPIYRHIYESLLGIYLRYEDNYAPFQIRGRRLSRRPRRLFFQRAYDGWDGEFELFSFYDAEAGERAVVK